MNGWLSYLLAWWKDWRQERWYKRKIPLRSWEIHTERDRWALRRRMR